MKKKAVDTPFLLVFCTLILCGLLIFTSAALGLLAKNSGATFNSVAVNQLLLGFVCGSIGLVILSRLDYRAWKKYTPYMFAGAMLLTMLTFVPGIGLELKGAARWVSIGSFSFQPVEILKFATVLFLAAIFAARYKKIDTWQGGILPLVLVAGSASAILLLQPDTHGLVMIVLSAAGMLFAAGGRISYLALLGVGCVLVIGVAALQRPYLMQRFETFLNQGSDPLGAGYQTQQALISVGSGQLTGRGFGQSIEKFSYLPEPIGDSIFAVAAEEFGFIGSSLLVLLYTAFAVLGLRIAARAPDPFGGLIVVGLIILIVGQSFLNISSILGLIPVSGLPLIFVSHGGTALAVSLAQVGVILSVSRHMRS